MNKIASMFYWDPQSDPKAPIPTINPIVESKTHAVCQTLFRSKKSGNQEFFSQKSGGYQEYFSIENNDFIQNYK